MSSPIREFDVFVSIVLPLRDAAGHVEQLAVNIDSMVRPLFRHYEVVFVDDASTDNTVEIVQDVQRRVQNIQLYCLNRRSGLDIAMVCGLDNAIGDFVITLNPESDPLRLVAQLWEAAQGGAEFVCGVRTGSSKGVLYRWMERRFQSLFASSTGLRVPVGASDARLYSRRVVGYINQISDRHLLLKVLPFYAAHRFTALEYEAAGADRAFHDRSLVNSILAGITILLSNSIRPMRILTVLAILASSLSLLFAVYIVVVALVKRNVVEGWVSLALPMAVMFFLVSTILGLLSEYIFLLAQNSQNRPVYSISKESTSSVLKTRQQLNVVQGSGEFAKEDHTL